MFKIPIIIVTISYIIGILWGIYVKNIFLFFVVHSFMIVLYRSLYKMKSINAKIRFILNKIHKNIVILFIIFSMLGYLGVKFKESKFEEIYLKQNLIVTIISDNIEEEYANKYIGRLEKYNIKIYVLIDKNTKFEYGDILKINGNVNEPEEQRNAYGFDYKQYLKSINVVGSIYLEDYKILGKRYNIFEKFIYDLQKSIQERIYKIIKSENKYLLEALILGNKENVSSEINTIFKDSSLSHMIAISGTHIIIIITLLYKAFDFIKLGKRNKYYISILIIFMYMFIAGATASVIRACIAIIFELISKLVHKKSNIYVKMCISAMMILILNPYSIVNTGFILSYGGVIGILIYRKIREDESHNKGIKKYIKESCILSICVQIIIFPILINLFNNISFTFFISNLIASPIVSLILNIGIISIVLSYVLLPISVLLGKIIDILISILIYLSNICADLPFSNNICTRIDWYIIIIYYILIVYIIYLIKIDRVHIIKYFLKKYILKLIAIILVFTISINIYNNLGIKNLEIYFIDVGQGDSSLIKTPYNKVILIDGGGENSNSDFKVGEKTLLPYLLNRKIKKIDYIVVSHFDSDHVGGLLYIMEKVEIKNIVIGTLFENSENLQQFLKIVKERELKVIIVEAGSRINIEKNLYFDVLWPSSSEVIEENAINNNSLVCKLYYKDFSMLFTGDIEAIAEEKIYNKYKNTNILKSTILKVAHHGSKTSSTEKILNEIKPKIALIGVGKDNNFGHPSDTVLQSFDKINSKIYRTDKCGEISIKVNNKCNILIKKLNKLN